MSRRIPLLLVSIGFVAGCGPKAQLFSDMGKHSRPVTTESDQAREYFTQGLTWTYAFNHDEAIRSFTQAAALDPNFAMAWWGVALCQGPNYNDVEMTDARSSAAWEAMQKALALIDHATPVERALIEALSHRYARPWPKDRKKLDQAYADAMAEVWERFPDDADVGTLYAEAMMTQIPWQLYSLDFKPAQTTPTIEATLERVLAMNPEHPGANHLYIHAVEASDSPQRGIPAADRLSELVPGAGHLNHMPSHIYVKTGHWDRAIEQNEKAMAADAKYRVLSPKQGIQHMYRVHNAHMLAFAAMMTGREREALAAARAMWTETPREALADPAIAPILDPWMCAKYDVLKRFGSWEEIIAEPAPPKNLPITNAIWRAHRAIAFAAKRDFTAAEREQEAFAEAMAAIGDDVKWSTDAAKTILAVAEQFVAGEIALQKGDLEAATEALAKGIQIEDALTYSEPPQWTQPVRHTLGAVYLSQGRYKDAERIYREDLAKWPDNGWSLYGLSRAIEGQGRTPEASEVERRFRLAWKHADAPTTTSCKCIPRT
jgi:tetratricopeptide (TPR) repeat protein